MSWKISCASLLLFGIAAGALNAQAYDIKVKENGAVGKVVTTTRTNVTTKTIKVSVAGKVVQRKSEEVKKETVADTVILKAGEPKPRKYMKTFTKAVVTKGLTISNPSYHEQSILAELKDGKYHVQPQGDSEVSEDDLKELTKQANSKLAHNFDKVFLPGRKVQVGESWPVDVKLIATGLVKDLPVDFTKSSASGKLVKVYDNKGHQFGILEYGVKLVVPQLGSMKLAEPALLNAKMTFDVAIDGSSTAAVMTVVGKLSAKFSAQQGGQNFDVAIEFTTNEQQVQSAEN